MCSRWASSRRSRRSTERRAYPRQDCQIRAILSWNKDSIPAIIQDVSARGLSLASETAVPVYQLMRLRVEEGFSRPIEVTAMAVWVTPTDETAVRIGAELYGNSREQVEAWQEVVVDGAKANLARDLGSRRDTRRDFERFRAILEVRVATADELVTLYTDNVSAGGMFIATNMDLDDGDHVVLDLVHPDNDTIMHLEARVVRRERQGRDVGVAVEFVGLDEGRREALWQFVSATVEF